MSTTEEPQKLYAAREPVFPKRVSGKFRNLKWIIMIVTLGIYYVTPWIRFDRGPNLPDQAVLLDLANRRFFFFWIEIWPHEFYFVAGLSDHGGPRPVPVHLGAGPGVVRLCLPPDCLDGPVLRGGAMDRG
jgi:hypothetical protein